MIRKVFYRKALARSEPHPSPFLFFPPPSLPSSFPSTLTLQFVNDAFKLYRCHTIMNCSKVCPKVRFRPKSGLPRPIGSVFIQSTFPVRSFGQVSVRGAALSSAHPAVLAPLLFTLLLPVRGNARLWCFTVPPVC